MLPVLLIPFSNINYQDCTLPGITIFSFNHRNNSVLSSALTLVHSFSSQRNVAYTHQDSTYQYMYKYINIKRKKEFHSYLCLNWKALIFLVLIIRTWAGQPLSKGIYSSTSKWRNRVSGKRQRMETNWKATSENLTLPLLTHKYLDERAENSTVNLKLYK